MAKSQITLKHIGVRAGVTSMTVSRILRDPEHSSYPEETRKRVLKAAKDLHYSGNRLAGSMRSGRSRLIGIIIPYNQPELLDSIKSATIHNDYRTILEFSSMPDSDDNIKSLLNVLEYQVDGIIWLPAFPKVPSKVEAALKRSGTPIVFLERHVQGFSRMPLVWVDWNQAFSELISVLKEKGYSKCSLLKSANDDSKIEQLHEQELSRVCQQLNFPMAADSILDTPLALKDFEHATRRKGEKIALLGQIWPVVSVSNISKEIGIKLPDSLGLVMLGDILLGDQYHLSQLMDPRLTALSVNYAKIANVASGLLFDSLKTDATTLPSRKFLLPSIVWHPGQTI